VVLHAVDDRAVAAVAVIPRDDVQLMPAAGQPHRRIANPSLDRSTA
jgi:hypothetical protein